MMDGTMVSETEKLDYDTLSYSLMFRVTDDAALNAFDAGMNLYLLQQVLLPNVIHYPLPLNEAQEGLLANLRDIGVKYLKGYVKEGGDIGSGVKHLEMAHIGAWNRVAFNAGADFGPGRWHLGEEFSYIRYPISEEAEE
jgi:hypothetical protein